MGGETPEKDIIEAKEALKKALEEAVAAKEAAEKGVPAREVPKKEPAEEPESQAAGSLKAEAQKKEEPEEAETDAPEKGKAEQKNAEKEEQKKTSKRKKTRISVTRVPKKLSIVILVLEFLLLAGITVTFVMYSRADYQNSGKQAEKRIRSDVSCSDGLLKVERVSVNVPSNGDAKYSIAYTWAEDDKDYPSVPYAAVASYLNDGVSPAYEISLYRESYTPNKKVPKGKTADNWFSDWKEKDADGIVEKRLDSGKVHGFLISNLKGSTINSDYRSYTYTFAVKDKKGISVYVLEGVCYDDESLDEFGKIMNDAVASIAISKTA